MFYFVLTLLQKKNAQQRWTLRTQTRFDGVARWTWGNGGSLQVNEVGFGSAVLAGLGAVAMVIGGDLMGSDLEDELVDLSSKYL